MAPPGATPSLDTGPRPERAPRPFRSAGATEAIRALALGANVWVIALVLPMVHGGARGVLDVLAAPLPLVPLALGVAALARNGARPERAGRSRAIAVAMLLVAFPVALAIVLASRADLADRDAWGPLGLFVAAVSLLGYGAIAAEACARPLGLRASTAQALSTPLGAAALVAAPDRRAVADRGAGLDRRTVLRRGVIAAATLGGLAVAVVAPALGSRAALLRAWGDAADEATVLASIVGASASAFALAALIGPRLRAARPGDAPRRPALRIALTLLIGASALVAYLLLRQLEAT